MVSTWISTRNSPGSKWYHYPCFDCGLSFVISYGEIGTYILSNVLCNLFPDDAFPDDGAYPLSIQDFRLAMLVPEAAAALIMQDRNVDHSTAIQIMISSGKYGTSAFSLTQEHVYDQMITEMCPAKPAKVLNLRPKSLNTSGDVSNAFPTVEVEVSGDVTEALSDDTAEAVLASEPADSASSWLTDEDHDGTNGTDSTPLTIEYCTTRVRRRKMPRSSIPSILADAGEEGDGSDQESSTSFKRVRLG